MIFRILLHLCSLINPQYSHFDEFSAELGVDSAPMRNVYYLRTRIIIEKTPFSGVMNCYGTTQADIQRDIAVAEQVYETIGLKLVVESTSFVEYSYSVDHCYQDASKYPECLSIYYVLPKDFRRLAGEARPPWYNSSYGVILFQERDSYTLSHELGHYLGLHHTFLEDYCDDTEPQQIPSCFETPAPMENCRNVMSYCCHEPQFLTCDQLSRALSYLRVARKEQLRRYPPQHELYLLHIAIIGGVVPIQP